MVEVWLRVRERWGSDGDTRPGSSHVKLMRVTGKPGNLGTGPVLAATFKLHLKSPYNTDARQKRGLGVERHKIVCAKWALTRH